MTPKDKHTEVAWQAKQREVKTGSVEKTVHSATSAIYTASEIRSVMSHSETQEITGNHITREQQLQNMRLATQKYLQPGKSSKYTKYLAGKHWTYGTGCCTTGNPVV